MKLSSCDVYCYNTGNSWGYWARFQQEDSSRGRWPWVGYNDGPQESFEIECDETISKGILSSEVHTSDLNRCVFEGVCKHLGGPPTLKTFTLFMRRAKLYVKLNNDGSYSLLVTYKQPQAIVDRGEIYV